MKKKESDPISDLVKKLDTAIDKINLAVDVSDEKRDEDGKWTSSGSSSKKEESKDKKKDNESQLTQDTIKNPAGDSTIYRGSSDKKNPEDFDGGTHWTLDPSYAAQYNGDKGQDDLQSGKLKDGKYLDFRNLGENFSPKELEDFLDRNGIDKNEKTEQWNGGKTISEIIKEGGDNDWSHSELEDAILRSAGFLVKKSGYDGFVFGEQGDITTPSIVVFHSKNIKKSD